MTVPVTVSLMSPWDRPSRGVPWGGRPAQATANPSSAAADPRAVVRWIEECGDGAERRSDRRPPRAGARAAAVAARVPGTVRVPDRDPPGEPLGGARGG